MLHFKKTNVAKSSQEKRHCNYIICFMHFQNVDVIIYFESRKYIIEKHEMFSIFAKFETL